RLLIVVFAKSDNLKMRQDVLGDNTRCFYRIDPRLYRQARQCGVDFRDRVRAHESPVLSCGNTQQRRPGLRVVGMALLGGGNKNRRVEEHVHTGYVFRTDWVRSSRTSSRRRSHFAPGSAVPTWTHSPSTLTIEARCS